VLDEGEPRALHQGSTGLVGLGAAVEPGLPKAS
jgi:hypothetical protein